MRYKLTIAYDGTRYAGWQVQATGLAIQPQIQTALATILGHPLSLTGAGRTDAGVHALGQTAHFDTHKTFETKRLILGMNALLPDDIRVMAVESVDDAFHARYSAVEKRYDYTIHLDPVSSPFTDNQRYHVLGPFDRDAFRQAALRFIGEHDFTSFANEAHRGSASRGAIRTIKELRIVELPDGIRVELVADGFLYKMARNIVGTLIDVAAGRCKANEIDAIFQAKDRKKAGMCAPPQGLCLISVRYKDNALGNTISDST
ncbi:MAG: tRNA pseudouridine synthase [Chlamydiota bacterium]|jgi:tRNA pseudouridine38-40 synthase